MTEHFLVPADLWTELFTYIAARVDVRDGSDGRQLPNEAMTLYDRMEREARVARPEARAKDYRLLDNLTDAAAKFRDAFTYDPGHSDLDNEQPIHITVTLGDWRRLNMLLPREER